MKYVVLVLLAAGLVCGEATARCVNSQHQKEIQQGRRSTRRYSCPIRNNEASAFDSAGMCERCGCSRNEHTAE